MCHHKDSESLQMKSCILGLALILLASSNSTAAQKPEAVQEVSYCDLVKTPQEFVGKRIRVRAIYKYGFEIQHLDSPACCPVRGTKIWVEIESGLEGDSLKLYRKFPKGMGLALATLEGAFESGGPYGDGGYRLKFTVDKIVKLEGTARASAHHDPAWVPKNCETSDAASPKWNASTALHEVVHVDAVGQFVQEQPERYRYAYDAPTHKFTGKERDAESGLDNFEVRYMGAWLSLKLRETPGGLPFVVQFLQRVGTFSDSFHLASISVPSPN
jgi:hypothetical protein